jgi:hydrogenase nickel incorporation protein HypA/HybF
VLAVGLEAAGDQDITRMRVRAGRLLAVDQESWQMSWQMLREGTAAAGATMELVQAPIVLRCRSCGQVAGAADPLACGNCHALTVEVVSGDQIVVEEVELAGGEVLRNPALTVAGEA